MHRGLPCSGLSSSKLVTYGPPGTSFSTFSSFRMSPPTSSRTCDDDDIYEINEDLFKF
jgi:hypothetical protein